MAVAILARTKKPDGGKAKSRQKAAPATSFALGLRQEFGLTRRMLARMTGLSERTLASWEKGVKLNDGGQRAVKSLERLLRAMAEVVRKEAIAGWLESPNEAFDGLKPVEVMERGETDRLWRMVYFLGSGAAS